MAKIVTVRLADDLHRKARMKLAEHSASFQAILEAFIDEWVNGRRTFELPKNMDASDVSQLEYILEHGTKEQIESFRGSLKIFAKGVGSDDEDQTLDAQEKRLIEEYRSATLEKRRRILGLAAKGEDLGPEVVAPPKTRTSRHVEKAG